MNASSLVLALFLSVTACAADHGQMRTSASPDEARAGGASNGGLHVVRYDQPFRLAFGRTVRIERSATRARFAELLEDSRCPQGVECIQAGRARVRLEVWRDRTARGSIDLGTDRDASAGSVGGVTWELQAVEPYPTAGGERRPERYVITLVARPLR